MASDDQNIEQKMTYADFQNLCKTYCNGKTSHNTSKDVPKCWSSNGGIFGPKRSGYRFECQCVGSREYLRLEGCGNAPYYDESKGSTKCVIDNWPKVQDGKKTDCNDFFNICKAFCKNSNGYYCNSREGTSGLFVSFKSSKSSMFTTKGYKGYLFNCICNGNKEERLSVSDG